jgi:PAS domain S-box-containing protein
MVSQALQQAEGGWVDRHHEIDDPFNQHNWASSPLGPPETWPVSLGVLVRVLRAASQPMFMAWGKDRLLLYNSAYGTLIGDRHPAAFGRPLFAVWDEVLGTLSPLIARIFSGEPVHMDHLPLKLWRDGEWEEAHFTYAFTPVRDETGQIAGMLCVCTETTAAVRAARQKEAELRSVNAQLRLEIARREADRDHLRLALDAAGIMGIWDADLAAGMVYGDANLARIYGVEPEAAAAGQRRGYYANFIHPEDRTDSDVLFHVAIDEDHNYAHEHRIIRPDGELRWVQVRGRVVRDANGKAVRFAGSSLDQTERKQSEARQAFLLQLADDLRKRTEPDDILRRAASALGVFLGANRVGYGQLQPDGKTIMAVCGYAQGVPAVNGAFPVSSFGAGVMARVQKGETAAITDLRDDPQNYSEIWDQNGARAHVSVPLMKDQKYRGSLYVSKNKPYAWTASDVALIEDVASRIWDAFERGRAETELREANALLEERVAAALEERSRIEEALRQSQKMEAVGQLTGGLAHDFNNLLAGISGSLELLKIRLNQGRLPDAERYITAAQASANRAAALTHRLLAFSRRQTLDPKPTPANTLILSMVELIQRTVGPQIAVRTMLAEPLWTVLCDPHQLENAILNLAINARDAMPDGGTLMIETANTTLDARNAADRDMQPGDYIAINVADTGTGMEPDVAARAFDPFFTTKPIGMGTGLGLSMIYGFAKQSEGQVRIHSTLGQGTTVKILLPRAGKSETEDEAAALAEVPRAELGETVLVVDDEATIRMLVTEVLEELGYVPLEAADAAEGLKILQSKARIDLLISDVGLPGGMNGRQMADAARHLRPGLKVLFITGYAEQTVVSGGTLEAGMHVMSKPFPLDALAARIKSILLETEKT